MLCKAAVMVSTPWLNFSNKPGSNRFPGQCHTTLLKLFLLSLSSNDWNITNFSVLKIDSGLKQPRLGCTVLNQPLHTNLKGSETCIFFVGSIIPELRATRKRWDGLLNHIYKCPLSVY